MTVNWDFKDEFVCLCNLRASGRTNMFGATPYLINEMDIPQQRAMNALINWMENFAEIDAFLRAEGLIE